jgi:hypothetical protein
MKSTRRHLLAQIFSISEDANGGMKFKSITVCRKYSVDTLLWHPFFDVSDGLSSLYSEALTRGQQCNVTVYSAGDMTARVIQVDLTTVQFRVGEVEPETELATEQAENERLSAEEADEVASQTSSSNQVSLALSLYLSLSLCLSLFSLLSLLSLSLSLSLALSLSPLSLALSLSLSFI